MPVMERIWCMTVRMDKLFLNDVETVSYHDRDEGAERLGMGVFLAKQYLLTGMTA